jgi:hypothetical protein
MWNDDYSGEYMTVVYREDGGFVFYPQNMELVEDFLTYWREVDQKNYCGAV